MWEWGWEGEGVMSQGTAHVVSPVEHATVEYFARKTVTMKTSCLKDKEAVAHFTKSLVLGTRSTFTLVSYIWQRDKGGENTEKGRGRREEGGEEGGEGGNGIGN